MKKIHYCKCGHLLEPNHHQHGKFLGLKTTTLIPCTECKCHWYVPREYPGLEEKISLWLLVGCTALILILLGFAIYAISDNYQHLLVKDPDHILTKKIITQETVFKLAPVGIAIFMIFMGNMVFGFYLDHRRRKNTELREIPPTDSQGSKEE